jgi:hypothetical protein
MKSRRQGDKVSERDRLCTLRRSNRDQLLHSTVESKIGAIDILETEGNEARDSEDLFNSAYQFQDAESSL